MIFTALQLPGAILIDQEKIFDDRGFFSRTYCAQEFKKHGIDVTFIQFSTSFNQHPHTLRGMHYQIDPYAEEKLITCSAGALYDVIVDLRPDSPTYRQWTSIELTAENGRLVYIPKGFAHGFLTLTDRTEVRYHMSTGFAPSAACGFRWNDPAIGIVWPVKNPTLSSRDASFPDLDHSQNL